MKVATLVFGLILGILLLLVRGATRLPEPDFKKVPPECPDAYHLNYDTPTRNWGCCTLDGICLWQMRNDGAVVSDSRTFSSLADAATNRDPKQVAAFRRLNPCPATGKTTGACDGWVVDHIVPLCWNGADDPKNMTWQDKKTSYLKDKFEREACAMKNKSGK